VSQRSFSAALVAATMVLFILTLTQLPVIGQQRFERDTPKLPMARTWMQYKAKLPPYTPPRTPDGVPDLQGNWGGPGGAATDDIEEHEYVDVTTPPQESFISDPADGKIPYTPRALAFRNRIRAGLARGWPGESGERLYVDPNSFCLPNVGPRGGAYEIVQKPGYVMMLGARVHRVIPTDGRPRLNQAVKLWNGNARGRWEGDTLAVEFSNLNGMQWFDSVGNYYSTNTRMVERWKLVDANTIDYEITIEDPTIYTRPWKMNFPRKRAGTGATDIRTGKYAWRDTPEADANPYAKEVWENSCNEGNAHHLQEFRNLGFKWFTGPVLTP
jgi:hypothetical protein